MKKKSIDYSKVRSLVVLIVFINAAFLFGDGLRRAASRTIPGSAMQGCALNCTAAVPATGQAGAPVAFASSTTPSGCAGTPAFEWNFGDNSPVSSAQNPSHVYNAPGTYAWELTTRVSGGGAALIETVAGGLGEGNQAAQVSFSALAAVARDPQGRGIYIAEAANAGSLIRFINTGNAPMTIAGVTIAPGAVRLVAGGGIDLGDNVPGLQADLGSMTGLAASPDGQLLYFVEAIGRQVRALNTAASPATVGGVSIGSGNIGTLAGASAGFGSDLNGLSVNPATGDLYVADATSGVNKVLRIAPGGAISVVAGNGANTAPDAQLPPPPVSATNVPLLQPRAVKADAAGNIFIADTGHARVVKVEPDGDITLVAQFQPGPIPPNPYPSGLALFGGNLYAANGNAQTIMRVTGGTAVVAGSAGTACDYSTSICGDGGPGGQAAFNMLSGINAPPLAGIESDGNGLFILDQGNVQRSRVRYLNLSAAPVTIAGVTIGPNRINTIAGNGLGLPYDQGLATSASLNTPVGMAADAQGNLFIADTIGNRLRFINRGASAVTIFAGTPAAQTVAPGQIVTVNKDIGAGPGDGVPVNSASFETPQGLAITAQGLFIADSKRGPNVPPTFQGKRTGLVRFVNTTNASVTFYPSASSPIVVPAGHIATIAGGGIDSASVGNGGFATSGRLLGPSDIAVSPASGDLYIADVGNKAVRKVVRNTGVITSLSLPAAQYTGLGFDASGHLYVVNTDANTLLRETGPGSGAFNTLATGLNRPRDAAIDATGNAYVTGSGNHRIVQVTPTGAVTVFAGSTIGFAGDGGTPANARLNLTTPPLVLNSTTSVPETVGITTGPGGDLFFADSGNHRIRRISIGSSTVTCTRTGVITISAAQNSAPSLTGISPNQATAGGAAFTLTVNGTNFIAGSVVRWNGSDRTTSVASGTQLTAQIPASDIAAAGTANVTIFNPAPGGGVSSAATFTINNPAPSLTSLSPNQATAGGAAFTLTVNGMNFIAGSIVRWNGSDRTTSVASGTQLTAQIPASDIAAGGTANVTVFNPAPGGGLSSAEAFTITQSQPARVVRVENGSGSPGGAVSVAIELVSQGDENAVGFSLSYDAAVLGNPQAAPGADASAGLLNVNTSQVAQGRLGMILALPAGQRFAAGIRRIVVVTFTIAPNAAAGPAAINFADQPIAREVADVNAVTLQTSFVSGAVTVIPGFEADVSPRPNGNNGTISISDWVQLGRFAAALDTTTAGSEFQRADCAPRSTLGDGNLTLSDWVQGGRYSAGLDPVTPAGGPTMPAAAPQQAAVSERQQKTGDGEQTRLVRASASSDKPDSLAIYLDARGGENALSFSLQYDPARLRFAGAELSRELSAAMLTVNIRQLASGRVGVMLALPAGESLRAGVVELMSVRFTMSPGGSPAVARVGFGDEPVTRAAVDVNAQTVEANWADAMAPARARASVSVSAASFVVGALAPEAIVAAFGEGLATATRVPNALPLPLDLAGTRVTVRDSAGIERLASLLFVSPTQVNYLMPAETAAGLATVTIASGDGNVFSEAVEIAPAAPGLFVANADGQGVAAAVALRVKAGGSTSYEPVAQFDVAQGRYVATPVSLGAGNDEVYLLLFGTGMRSAGSLAAVKARIGGVETQVLYAGAQGDLAGLDQINLRLPRDLAGRGEVTIELAVDGQRANAVTVHLR